MKRLLPCIALFIALGGCSKSSELHDAMEEMKEPYKAMRETDDLNTIETQLAAFVQALAVAKVQSVKPEDQPIFEEGIKKLVELTEQAQAAVAAGNVEQAKSLLKKMGDVRKEYHDKLGVK